MVYYFVPDLNIWPPLQGIDAPGGLNSYVSVQREPRFRNPSSRISVRALSPHFRDLRIPPPTAVNRNAGRPPRQTQWSIGVQHEIPRDLVVEVSYVGNRGVWWTGAGANLGLLNQVSPATFAAYGLNPYTNPADNQFLSNLNTSPAVISRFGRPLMPYAGFSGSVLQALEAYPQFSNAGNIFGPYGVTNAPTGNTWYDSLQAKVTKRFSHGLEAFGTFTWSKALVSTRQDFWNPASSVKTLQATDQPFLFNANIVYTVPKVLESFNKVASWAVRDWQFGAYVAYGSGFLLTPPSVTNGFLNPLSAINGATSYMLRVPGQPLYTKDLNCGCINPYSDQLLNPAAWVNPPNGQYGGSAYYGDFRGSWRPQENFNIGRNFRIKENMNLQIRAEFVNILNRAYLAYPSTVNPLAAPSHNPAGQINGGFGTINETLAPYTNSLPVAPATVNGVCSGAGLCGQPRSGTLIARFTF